MLSEGQYAVTAAQGSVWGTAAHSMADLVVEVDSAIIGRKVGQTAVVSLHCREQANGDGYRFLFNSAGEIAVVKVSNQDENEYLLGWTSSSLIHAAGESNHLKAVCTQHNLRYDLNGGLVYAGQDHVFSSSVVGIGASSNEETPSLCCLIIYGLEVENSTAD